MHDSKTHNLTAQYGYLIGVLGVSLILIWLGIYKFTPTEAKLIEPLVLNHPLMGWTYQFLSVQAVSNLIVATEIMVGIGLLIGLRSSKVAYYSGIASVVIFISTLSFLITTPDTWKVSDGILVPNFFLLKDILFLAVAIHVIEKNKV
ncbi:YkgB family protein [Vibrio cholerae]|nr:YkgB family protein [Vibrio cholerae]